jgi:hypothetical protein
MDELEQRWQAGSHEDTSGKQQVNILIYLKGYTRTFRETTRGQS